MTNILIPRVMRVDQDDRKEAMDWLEGHGLEVLNLAKYYRLAGYGVEADELGFPKYRLPSFTNKVFTKDWAIGSYTVSHYWFNFPEDRTDVAMLFKLTFAG